MEAAALILLAEDEDLIAMSIQQALEDGGFSVRAVASGGEAILVLESDDP